MPESFQPPIGRPGQNTLVSASLMLTAPTSRRRATCSPRSVSPVQTLADRPYWESLARRMASSSSATLITGSVGPKVSSAMQLIWGVTSASTVGSKKVPTPVGFPPVSTLAPAATASSTCRSTMSRWAAVAMAPVSYLKPESSWPCLTARTLSVSLVTNSS